MSNKIPFHRNYRGFIKGSNSGYSSWAYIVDKEYAQSPEHYTRAFILIQNDLKKLFEYIEPADRNRKTYSYRIHELLIRTCIEVEANFKAILKENIYKPTDKEGNLREEKCWKIYDYKRINITHHLSSYKVLVPTWNGKFSIFEPFDDWKKKDTLCWYTAYNLSKHDRQSEFKKANFKNLLNAVSGLLVLLSSQFKTEDFSSGGRSLGISTDDYYSMTPAIGDFFRIEFPSDWDNSEKYDFDWDELKQEKRRFEKINYNLL